MKKHILKFLIMFVAIFSFAPKTNAIGLNWNTFGGGSGYDYGNAIVTDSSGNVYATGYSAATWGSPKRSYTGSADAFVAKYDKDGNLIWNTF